MTFPMQARLGTMMFLQYFIWGAWYVTVGTWLGASLHFSGQQIGWAAGATAVGAILAPFFVGLVADRLFATQKVLAALHAAGAVLLFLVARQAAFGPVYALLLLYCLCYMPTLALTNSLAFRQMSKPELEFSPIRVLGTIGWIVAGLLIGSLKLEATAVPLQLAAAASLVMAGFCLTLPNTPPLGKAITTGVAGIFPREAFSLLANRTMAVFAIASLLICIPLQFYYAFTNLFLNEIGVKNAAGKMSGGQMSELFCMLLIPWFFRRLGVKYMLAVGMAMWAIRYVLFAYGTADTHMGFLWAGILVHGICYDFFFVTGQIYIDRRSPLHLRAAAQGLITLITYGLGMFAGSWISGAVVDRYSFAATQTHNWRAIWLVPAISSAVILILFLFTFSDRDTAPATTTELTDRLPLESPAT